MTDDFVHLFLPHTLLYLHAQLSVPKWHWLRMNIYEVHQSQSRQVKGQIYVSPCLQLYPVDESLDHLEADVPENEMSLCPF